MEFNRRDKEKKMERRKMILTRILQITLILLVIGLSSGCGVPRLSKKARAGIDTVSVNTEVSMPDKMGYIGHRFDGASFGLLGALITSGVDDDEEERLNALMREHNIDVGKIVTGQFRDQLEAKRIFPSVVASGGDAEFSFEIHFYQISLRYGAALKVTVYLKKATGGTIWKATAWPGLAKRDTYLYEQYISDPALLQKAFEQAARIVVTELIDSMKTG